MYGCVRLLYFLRTRIEKHSHYPNVVATITSDPDARFLVRRLTLLAVHCTVKVPLVQPVLVRLLSGHYY
jgi:hypothetical protein